MKIDSALHSAASVQSKTVKSKSSRNGSKTATTALPGDNVELTSASSRMSELEAQLADLPATDAGKVAVIRQAIADGTFKVDEEAVADALVQETVEQLRHKQNR